MKKRSEEEELAALLAKADRPNQRPKSRGDRRRRPHVPAGYVRNPLGTLVRERKEEEKLRHWLSRTAPETIFAAREILRASRAFLRTPEVVDQSFQRAFSALFGRQPTADIWSALLLDEVTRLKLRSLELVDSTVLGFAERRVYPAARDARNSAGEFELRYQGGRFTVPAVQVRELRSIRAKRSKFLGRKTLRLPRTRRELEEFLKGTPDNEIPIALVDRALGEWVDVRVFLASHDDPNHLQALGIRELCRAAKEDTVRSILVELRAPQILHAEGLKPDQILDRIALRLLPLSMPAYADNEAVVSWIVEVLALGRGGGRHGQLSRRAVEKLLQDKDTLRGAMAAWRRKAKGRNSRRPQRTDT